MVVENEETVNSLCCPGLNKYSYEAEIRLCVEEKEF